MAINIFRIAALVALAGAAACGSSSEKSPWGALGGASGQGGTYGFDGGPLGLGGFTGMGGQTGIDGSTWTPAATCVERASALVEALTPAQRYGQMTTVDSYGLTVSEATSALLGSVFSGGSSDPAGGNTIADWTSLVSSYLDVAKGFAPHVGLLYGHDAVHGSNNVQDAVIFPHAIGIGASFDPALAEEVGRITALEMLGAGINWAFAPTVAAARDERWGRTYESFGEIPEVAGQMGAAMVRGLQNGRLGNGQSVLACAKHYAGDGATDGGKNAGDVTSLDEAAFRQVAIEPYRPAIEAGVGSIMVSYSSYQGTKMTAAKYWLTDVLKGELGFAGFLVSDWDALSQLPGAWPEQVETAINAGLDMVMLSHTWNAHSAADFASTLGALVDAGEVPVERVQDAVRRILTIKCEMGLLDGDTLIDPALTAAIGSAEHRAVARAAVRRSLVLLKNDGMLPLPKSLSRIHVTGSGADSLAKQCGGWTLGWQGLGTAGPATATTRGTTVLAAVGNALAATGTAVTTSGDGSGAAGADYAIVVVGEPPYAEGQGDSAQPTLSSTDVAAIAKVRSANVPFVVVLFSGRPLLLTDKYGVSVLDVANAFVAAWLPGTEGDGIADVLFGDYKPTGRLGFSWPATAEQIPINDGDGQIPLFPVGFGLTYP
ncbi:MAG: glycoside hydrolase family 3 C-terminal domain-containing protein [Deltaproteobacteria bacterium]|nr:glycoside hydrolase family 3 C-terminal domain-containing protein [Deltaproteobacteria bacterium]